jgi:hypothetical protein
MEDEEFFAGSLIIAEITGSITDKERRALNYLRSSNPDVARQSEFMHKVLNPDIEKIKQPRTSAAKIIEMGNDPLTNQLRRWIDQALRYFEKRKI